MDEELPVPESGLLIEFHKKDDKLYISVPGLEALMDEIVKNSTVDELDVESKKDMQDIILKFLDKGKVTALTDFP